jgi:MFS family permease
VPERVRGEALGWHGSAMTAGGALGAPVAGIAIDAAGWPGGFVACGAIGLAAATVGLLALRRRRPPSELRRAAPSDSTAHVPDEPVPAPH